MSDFPSWFDDAYPPDDSGGLDMGNALPLPGGTDITPTFPDPNEPYQGTGNIYGDPATNKTVWQKLMGGSQPGQNAGDLSKVLAGYSSGEKANRVVQGNFTQGYDRNMIAAQAARNQNESDALKKLNVTKYLLNGGSQFKLPPSLSIGGTQHSIPNLGYGPTPASDAQKQGASTLQDQLLSRLQQGGSYQPQPLNDYAKPGVGEQIGNYGALGTGALGALSTAFGGGGSQGGPSGLQQGIGAASTAAGLANKMGLLGGSGGSGAAGAGAGAAGEAGAGAGSMLGSIAGKAIPLAGAGMGIYNMLQNKGTMSNILSGAGTGASIGSIVPGIGTLIGGGVGALAGGIESLFNIGKPDQQELGGRGIEGNFEKSLGGFQGMMDAVGKGYAARGHSSQEAQTDVKAMMDAEKQGPQAVQSILQQIQAKMGGGAPQLNAGAGTSVPSTVPNQSPNFRF